MEPVTMMAVAAGASKVLGGVASYFGKRKQADRLRAETDEQVRRMRLQQAAVLGQTTAAGAASGFEFESEGLQKYLTDMAMEFRRQSEWAKKAGYQQAGDLDSSALFGGLTDIGGAMFSFGQANNWWKG